MTKTEKRNPFAVKTKTVRMDDWEEGITVTVKAYTHGEKSKLEELYMESATVQYGADGGAILDSAKIPAATLKAIGMQGRLMAIQEWTLSINGDIAPITAETINQLPDQDVEFIDQAIKELNPDPSGDDFLDDGGDESD